MADARLRELARAARAGEPAARAAHLSELLRTGQTTEARVALAADVGDLVAREVLGQPLKLRADIPREREASGHHAAMVLADLGFDLACWEAARLALKVILRRRLPPTDQADPRRLAFLELRSALGTQPLQEAVLEAALDRAWTAAQVGPPDDPLTAQLRALVAAFDARCDPRRNERGALTTVLGELSSAAEQAAFHAAFTPWLLDETNPLINAGRPPERLLVVERALQIGHGSPRWSRLLPAVERRFRAAGGWHTVEVRAATGTRRLFASFRHPPEGPTITIELEVPHPELPPGTEVWSVGP